jgi:hypothetical protein
VLNWDVWVASDDVFAALDAIVGKLVFERVVLGLLQAKTRVIVTHKEEIIGHPSVCCMLEVSLRGDVVKSVNPNNEFTERSESDDSKDWRLSSITKVPYIDSLSASLATALHDQQDIHGNVHSGDDDDDDDDEDMKCLDYSYSGKKVAPAKQGLDIEEDKSSGKIDVSVFKRYLEAAGGLKAIAMIFCIQTAWQVSLCVRACVRACVREKVSV